MSRKVIIIGPAWPLRGGLATFDQRLAQQFLAEGWDCEILSFSLQYPKLLFPGKTQYSTDAAPANLIIHSKINSVNPANWLAVGKWLKWKEPHVIVVRYWIPFMGPALGTILKKCRTGNTKIVCIADNVIPHEHRPGDAAFTRYFLRQCDAFITMSEKVLADLRTFEKEKPALLVRHPLYDNFGVPVSKEDARAALQLNAGDKIILFFGFVRHYKGLDILLHAMAEPALRQQNIKLLIAGEFYEDEKMYTAIIQKHQLAEQIILRNHFIEDAAVAQYLCAADVVVQPYRQATQSGVTPLAYYFEKPMIVTNVGGLPDLVPHDKAGLVCEPKPAAIAAAILEFYNKGAGHFIPHLRAEKQKYSWQNLTGAVTQLAQQT